MTWTKRSRNNVSDFVFLDFYCKPSFRHAGYYIELPVSDCGEWKFSKRIVISRVEKYRHVHAAYGNVNVHPVPGVVSRVVQFIMASYLQANGYRSVHYSDKLSCAYVTVKTENPSKSINTNGISSLPVFGRSKLELTPDPGPSKPEQVLIDVFPRSLVSEAYWRKLQLPGENYRISGSNLFHR